jgi:formylglycine-generating enzyme required for sulfatase activity/serine/threonine protein kinase
MADKFDPYHRWLGIPPKDQPPNHYRLLAIEIFETDPEVIVDAVQRQVAHVRTYHLGPQADRSQKILNEIAAAKACLLDPKKKAAYDAELRHKLAQAQPPRAQPEAIPDVIKRIGSPRLEQFVQHVMQSGLLTAAEISSYYQSLPPENRPQDAQSLARALVKANKLTKYQAESVYQGKVQGLAFGDYRVLDKLGEGGMGVVLKAQHQRMDRTVAVKMISGAALKSPDAAKRFYQEVKAAAKLNHPNIVQAYDASEQNGVHYLIMEYVEGKDLAAIVREKGPLPVAQAVDCVLQAARGLQYAHKQGIVHRDIKPANLLLDKEGTVKILDMGLARVVGLVDQGDKDPLTASGQIMGTCDYMAPEQAMDTHHADARADIYSLGCTLYRLVAGEAMYQGETLMQILLAHQQAAVPSLCKNRSGVPPQLDAVFQKMVAKKPEDRYQLMSDVTGALETYLGKREATATSVGAGATAAALLGNNPSFLQGVSPRRLATAAKNKVEGLAGATFSQQAAAAETSKQFGSGEKLQPEWRKKKSLPLAIGLGLLGVIGVIAFVVVLRIQRPQGTQQLKGSAAAAREAGGDKVEVVAAQPAGVSHAPDAPPPAVAPFNAAEAKQHQEAWGKHLGLPVDETNSIGMKFTLIPPGEFEMGSTPKEVAWALAEGKKDKESLGYMDRVLAESPQHRVKISKPFYLAMYQVTQSEYEKVTGVNPSVFAAKPINASAFEPPLNQRQKKEREDNSSKVAGKDTSRYPVECVNWDEAAEYCRKLSALPAERAARRRYRLPTEAEWEYACRSGTTTRRYFGNDEAGLADVAWFQKNAAGTTHPVGCKRPNAWGLYDMHGNVWQWCADWYSVDYYKQSPQSDPVGPAAGSDRVARGGAWASYASSCHPAYRKSAPPANHFYHNGFRVVGEIAPKREEQSPTPMATNSAGGSHAPPPAVAPFDATQAK